MNLTLESMEDWLFVLWIDIPSLEKFSTGKCFALSLKSSFVMSEYYNLELIKIGTKSFDSLESFSLSNNPKLKKLEINNCNVEDNYVNTLYTFSNINNILLMGMSLWYLIIVNRSSLSWNIDIG